MIAIKLLNALRKLLGNTAIFEINAFVERHDTIKLFRDRIERNYAEFLN